MRILGVVSVMSASVGMGILSVRQKNRRLHRLRALFDAFVFLTGELAGKQAPLPELVRSCCQYAQGDIRPFFQQLSEGLQRLGEKSFYDIWKETAMRLSLLTERERRELIALGKQLGRTELPRQLAALDGFCRFLSTTLDREERMIRNDRKLFLCIPSAMGALLTILLL